MKYKNIPPQIAVKLNESVARVRRILLVRGTCATLAVFVASVLAIMAIDAMVTIYVSWVRWLLWACCVGATVAVAWFALIKPLRRKFTAAEIAALIAPRAVCFDAGDRDELFGSGMSKKEYAAAKPFFEAQGAGDRIMLKCFDGGHELDPADDCMDFFFRHLNT